MAWYNDVANWFARGVDAIDPFDDKAAALAGIQDKLGGLKKDRLDRIESIYGRTNSQLDDTRKAIAAMYGDPSQWRL